MEAQACLELLKRMKKSFGQNFLIDKSYQEKIIDSMNLQSTDIVLEIGAGSGIMTILLAEKVKKVYAVEVERDVLKLLRHNLAKNNLENVEIIESNFLKLDIKKIISVPFKVFGNIPYNISSRILLKLFGEVDSPSELLQLFKEAYLMVQYEVGNRLVAKPSTKEYSPLTLLVQYFSVPKLLFKVSRSAFKPVPKVDSAFLSFDVKEKLPYVKSPSLLKNIIRTGFQQRRKKIINSLSKLFENKEILIQILKELELSAELRIDMLSLEDFIKIANQIYA